MTTPELTTPDLPLPRPGTEPVSGEPTARPGSAGARAGTGTRSAGLRPSPWLAWAVWTVGFLGFPVAGLAGTGVAGRVDSPAAALTGGAVAGLVVGIGQAALSRRRLDSRRWVPATAVGMGLGLLLGAAYVGYGTSLGELAVMGALTGVVLGLAQALALPSRTSRRWLWAAAMPALWATGWTVTTLAGIDVEEQYTLFGMSGALAFSAASGVLLHALVPPSGAGR